MNPRRNAVTVHGDSDEVAILVVMDVLNPHYAHVLFDDPLGRTILGIAAALQIVGSLIIWKIVRIKV